mmetsp:Transcript_21158/g.20325  ORF Transcript_21158/g.20325 Transcript_21158/m.20325 type:complete len:89 (+) Transcript_21158:976-1242(+)
MLLPLSNIGSKRDGKYYSIILGVRIFKISCSYVLHVPVKRAGMVVVEEPELEEAEAVEEVEEDMKKEADTAVVVMRDDIKHHYLHLNL